MGKPVFLRRSYKTAPYNRYALTCAPADTPDGYTIDDHDPQVADSVFIHAFREHMARPAMVQTSAVTDRGIEESIKWVHPGEEGHFGAAVRTVPGAMLWGSR